MTVKNVRIEPSEIKKNSVGKAQGAGPSNFDSFLGAMDAMTPMNTELMYQATGSSNAAAVLHGAFTGVSGAAGAYGYGGGAGIGTGYGGFGGASEYPGMLGYGSAGTYAGASTVSYKAEGGAPYKTAGSGDPSQSYYPTQELMNTMNVNNLKLLELQAVMQSNMQAWNTKSNILSADHRARMAMIEKFAARG
jgi:hypothetical protein